ncbi:MFS transporter [Pikeienuella piscinae]|uniref:MFS transporter n=1 Tax=Pikeienuella piscinae TaxID=2748098 RepID=A0A7L5BYV1_9RHOB|nr:MFS transporter [Pikeienuella piscinae]QIE55426.1 MFS transporter [Pikeienuella piscinae]
MAASRLFTPVLIAASAIIIVSFAVRASFGVFQLPVANEFGWPRIEFSLAIAIQNLAWGIGQPLFAAFAERYGDRLALLLGALTYCAGMVLSAFATTPEAHQALAWLVGFGIAGTGFGVILGVVGRAATAERRSFALGVATAAGSVGQMIGPPIAAALLVDLHWSQVFIVFGVAVLAVMAVLPFIRETGAATNEEAKETMRALLGRAVRDPSFTLIFLGFFSCGYQLAFITAHFPAMVTELCGPVAPGSIISGLGVTTTAQLGAWAIGLIGLANIGGTLLAGRLGQRWSKKYLLAVIYTGRTIVAAVFILAPITPESVLIFSVVMGALWLATVPLTSGLIAQIYGIRYMGTLFGVVFLSHQIGGFMGVWLGGAMYDAYGGYELVWWIGVGVGAFSALVHLPIRERPMRAALAA